MKQKMNMITIRIRDFGRSVSNGGECAIEQKKD